MTAECDICREMAPLACDTHAELRALERQGYLDALDLFENVHVHVMMEQSHRDRIAMSSKYGIDPSGYAYLKGRWEALNELIAVKIE